MTTMTCCGRSPEVDCAAGNRHYVEVGQVDRGESLLQKSYKLSYLIVPVLDSSSSYSIVVVMASSCQLYSGWDYAAVWGDLKETVDAWLEGFYPVGDVSTRGLLVVS